MKQHQKIKLFGSRDFSDNFDMTLTFLKQNYGAILGAIYLLIPLMLLIVFLTPNTDGIDFSGASTIEEFSAISVEILTLNYLIAQFLSTVCTFLIYTYVVAYMALYVKSENGVVKNSEVWSKVLNTILPVFIASIIYGILVVIGSIFCLIPGIMIFVYLGFYIYAYVSEDCGLIASFQRSYDLVRNNWWVTFGYGLVFFLLTIIGGLIFSIPSLLSGLGRLLNIEFLSGDVYAYITTIISEVGTYLLNPILYVAMGVMYYSHRNKLEGVDMESEIDNIGNTQTNY